MNKYKTFKKIYISYKDEETIKKINERISCGDVYYKKPDTNTKIVTAAYIYTTPSNIHIIARYILTPKLVEYIINDEGKDHREVNVASAFREFKKYIKKGYKINDNMKIYKNKLSSKALLWYNKEYQCKRLEHCYGYDLNKCYLNALLQPIPDTTKMRKNGIVKKGEIGFIETSEIIVHIDKYDPNNNSERKRLRKVKVGQFANYIFPLIESPFKDYVTYMTDEITKAKQQNDKDKEYTLKQNIVCSVGNLQNHDPFVRASIVEYANDYIKALMDENTIYVNTDCLICLQPRKDLDIGNKVGQFKEEHIDETFYYENANYNWSDGTLKQRGHHKDNIKYIYLDSEKREIKYVEAIA